MVETDPQRSALIGRGEAPIHEPGLDPLLRQGIDAGTLKVTTQLESVLTDHKVLVLAVGTPSLPDGRTDLRALDAVAAGLAEHAEAGTVVVIKSTVPPGTGRRMERQLGGDARNLRVVSCPEFLREGSAIADIAHSDRFVVGGSDEAAVSRVVRLLNPFNVPVVRSGNTEAELIKYGANAFLAMKISFINEIANLCDHVDANIDDVAAGMGMDARIGAASLRAGLGFGGSCFPKDVVALEHAARSEGFTFWMLRAAMEVNEQQRIRFVQKIRVALGSSLEGRRIAMLGLAFKPGTDDMRQAPSLVIAERLVELGATVVAHDPAAMSAAKLLLPQVTFAADPYSAMEGADLVALVTEWPEYLDIDWQRAASMVRRRVVVDGRNCLNQANLAAQGFNYHGIGRPPETEQWDRRETAQLAGSAADPT